MRVRVEEASYVCNGRRERDRSKWSNELPGGDRLVHVPYVIRRVVPGRNAQIYLEIITFRTPNRMIRTRQINVFQVDMRLLR